MPYLVKVAGYERQQTSKSETAVLMLKSPHVRKSGFQNPGKFLAWNYRIREKYCLWYLESWALESGIKLKESGMPLQIGI